MDKLIQAITLMLGTTDWGSVPKEELIGTIIQVSDYQRWKETNGNSEENNQEEKQTIESTER
jgi:hypothetical protein